MKSNIIRRLTLLSPAILFSLSLPLTGLAEESAGDQSEPQTYARFVPERSDDFAWENDLIAFRAYGPTLRDSSENSGFDCWLKRVDYPIVDKWYQQNSEGMSYHKDHGEGLDNYKVGDSAGCGGTGIWINGEREPLETFTEHEVIELTAERSQFKLSYERDIDGVIYGEEKIVTVEMGTRLFTVDSTFFKDGKPAADLPVCVGLLSNDGKGQHSSDKAQGWIAIWEELDDSELGTGAKMAPARVDEIKYVKKKGKLNSHLFLITRTDEEGKLRYQAGYGWKKAGGIQSQDQWEAYLSSAGE